jgi:hypothetical protein
MKVCIQKKILLLSCGCVQGIKTNCGETPPAKYGPSPIDAYPRLSTAKQQKNAWPAEQNKVKLATGSASD